MPRRNRPMAKEKRIERIFCHTCMQHNAMFRCVIVLAVLGCFATLGPAEPIRTVESKKDAWGQRFNELQIREKVILGRLKENPASVPLYAQQHGLNVEHFQRMVKAFNGGKEPTAVELAKFYADSLS